MKYDIEQDVVFRVYPTGEVLALWPACSDGFERQGLVRSYAHVGQHGAADYVHVLQGTRPARPTEYRALLAELRQRGYRPRVIRRATRRHIEQARGRTLA